MILDVLFYSILVWLAVFIIGLIQRQMLDPKLILLALPITTLLAVFLWMFYLIFGFTAGFDMIGRGHGNRLMLPHQHPLIQQWDFHQLSRSLLKS